MVKYLALAVALVFSLVVVDLAQAGRRCHGGCGGGGCPGGVCAVPVVPGPPAASVTNAPPAAVVVAPAPATQTAPQYYTSARRGLFGWRR